MSDPFDPEKQEEPLDPAVERVQQKLRKLLFGSSLIMFLGLAAVLAAIAYKISERSDEEQQAYRVPDVVTDENLRRASYPLPDGSEVTGTTISDGDLAVTYRLANGKAGVLLIDIASWQVYSDITF